MIFVFVWLHFSRSIHVAADGIVSFFSMVEWYSVVSMYHIFIHLSVDGHLGCSHALTIVNSAAVDAGVHVSFRVRIFVFSGWVYAQE